MIHPIVSWYSKYNFISFLITFPFQMKYFVFYRINVITSSNGKINQKYLSSRIPFLSPIKKKKRPQKHLNLCFFPSHQLKSVKKI